MTLPHLHPLRLKPVRKKEGRGEQRERDEKERMGVYVIARGKEREQRRREERENVCQWQHSSHVHRHDMGSSFTEKTVLFLGGKSNVFL